MIYLQASENLQMAERAPLLPLPRPCCWRRREEPWPAEDALFGLLPPPLLLLRPWEERC